MENVSDRRNPEATEGLNSTPGLGQPGADLTASSTAATSQTTNTWTANYMDSRRSSSTWKLAAMLGHSESTMSSMPPMPASVRLAMERHGNGTQHTVPQPSSIVDLPVEEQANTSPDVIYEHSSVSLPKALTMLPPMPAIVPLTESERRNLFLQTTVQSAPNGTHPDTPATSSTPSTGIPTVVGTTMASQTPEVRRGRGRPPKSSNQSSHMQQSVRNATVSAAIKRNKPGRSRGLDKQSMQNGFGRIQLFPSAQNQEPMTENQIEKDLKLRAEQRREMQPERLRKLDEQTNLKVNQPAEEEKLKLQQNHQEQTQPQPQPQQQSQQQQHLLNVNAMQELQQRQLTAMMAQQAAVAQQGGFVGFSPQFAGQFGGAYPNQFGQFPGAFPNQLPNGFGGFGGMPNPGQMDLNAMLANKDTTNSSLGATTPTTSAMTGNTGNNSADTSANPSANMTDAREAMRRAMTSQKNSPASANSRHLTNATASPSTTKPPTDFTGIAAMMQNATNSNGNMNPTMNPTMNPMLYMMMMAQAQGMYPSYNGYNMMGLNGSPNSGIPIIPGGIPGTPLTSTPGMNTTPMSGTPSPNSTSVNGTPSMSNSSMSGMPALTPMTGMAGMSLAGMSGMGIPMVPGAFTGVGNFGVSPDQSLQWVQKSPIGPDNQRRTETMRRSIASRDIRSEVNSARKAYLEEGNDDADLPLKGTGSAISRVEHSGPRFELPNMRETIRARVEHAHKTDKVYSQLFDSQMGHVAPAAIMGPITPLPAGIPNAEFTPATAPPPVVEPVPPVVQRIPPVQPLFKSELEEEKPNEEKKFKVEEEEEPLKKTKKRKAKRSQDKTQKGEKKRKLVAPPVKLGEVVMPFSFDSGAESSSDEEGAEEGSSCEGEIEDIREVKEVCEVTKEDADDKKNIDERTDEMKADELAMMAEYGDTNPQDLFNMASRYWLDQHHFVIEELKKRGFEVLRNGRHYECSLCSAKFTKLIAVNRHASEHVTTKPYECMLCGRNFSRSDSLSRHVNGRCKNAPNKKPRKKHERRAPLPERSPPM